MGLRHEDMGIAERAVTVTPRPNANRARAKAGISRAIPASAELMRLYAGYLTGEYGSLDSDYVLRQPVVAALWPPVDLCRRL